MIYFGIAITIFGFDYFLKKYLDKILPLHTEKSILKDKIIINKLYNKGAALNFMQNHPKALKFLTSGFIISLILVLCNLLRSKGNGLCKLGLAFTIGGSLSNAWDRYTKKYVIDYFSFPIKKIRNIVFNISDMFIFIGCIILVIVQLFPKKK